MPVDDELFSRPVILADDPTAAGAALDAAISECAAPPDPTYRALTALVNRIRDDDRLHRVAQVMELSPWGTRTTQRVFRGYVGIPVKWVLCRYRLQHAALVLERDPAVDSAASPCGWAGTTRRTSSTTSARCLGVHRGSTPRGTGSSLLSGR